MTSSTAGSPLWNAGDTRLPTLAAEILTEIRAHGPERVAAALDDLLRRRAGAFLDGIEAYRRHPYRRPAARVPTRWRRGAARLLDYGGGDGPAVLIVPSLINRYYILDLLRERSFVRHLAASGLRPLVLDWGELGAAERQFDLGDYITGPLSAALDAAVKLAGGPVAVVGYCMGGLLALALALRRPDDIAALALLATPWDFHAERMEQGVLLAGVVEAAARLLGAGEPLPVSLIQGLFAALDPFLAERKFVGFAGLDPKSEAARGFVALEDWINDGVRLAQRVALDCARSWYRDNDPTHGRWLVDGRKVRPEQIAAPTLVILPSRDRIVPPRSAAPLAAAIPGARVLRPPFGHIGMMTSAAAPDAVWRPITEWLGAQLAAEG